MFSTLPAMEAAQIEIPPQSHRVTGSVGTDRNGSSFRLESRTE